MVMLASTPFTEAKKVTSSGSCSDDILDQKSKEGGVSKSQFKDPLPSICQASSVE